MFLANKKAFFSMIKIFDEFQKCEGSTIWIVQKFNYPVASLILLHNNY
jgi:hypothetical protein